MRNINSLMLSALLTLPLTGLADKTENSEVISQQVREQVVAFNMAYEQNDLATYFAFYLEDMSMWINSDIVTIAEYKKDWYALIAAGGGVEKVDLSEINVAIGPSGDSAVAAYRSEVQTRMADGKVTLENAQETDTWFLVNGQWRIAHLHYASQPVEK